ncbi:hypothetical protein HC928_19670 [bacterium]|nr:hypothetical protein [bacterium]
MPLQPIGAAGDPRGFDPVYGRGGQVSGFPSPYIVGDVTVHPSAAIAPGAILQAAPGSHIAIASGVCLGVGVILNACGGAIAVERNATLGAGVLIVGTCTIGEGACIGTATTVFTLMCSDAVIPAGQFGRSLPGR